MGIILTWNIPTPIRLKNISQYIVVKENTVSNSAFIIAAITITYLV